MAVQVHIVSLTTYLFCKFYQKAALRRPILFVHTLK